MEDVESRPVRIVGIGGTPGGAGSSTEQALLHCMRAIEGAGASVQLFDGAALADLPHYLTPNCTASTGARALIDAVRQADGVVIASPGYHGSISGMVKNALDYLQETASDPRPYLDGLPVGLISTAYGWQAAIHTMAALRSVVHALRGWPTPMGASIKVSEGMFRDGDCASSAATEQLALVSRQVVEFAQIRMLSGRCVRG